MKRIILPLFFSASALLVSNLTVADNFSSVEKKIKSAMAADVRSEQEKMRDTNRKPIETLKFFGLRDDMKVVEFIPGGGWYTKILAPVLAEKGELILAFGTGRAEKDLLTKPGFEKVKVTAKESSMNRPEDSYFFDLDEKGFDVKQADMVLTFRNYHNLSDEGRKKMNEAAYKALKKGGIYGVVDHTRRHMEPTSAENRRRADPVLTIKEVQDAGFEFVDYTNLHYHAKDTLIYEVGNSEVSGKTDRYTFMFKKI